MNPLAPLLDEFVEHERLLGRSPTHVRGLRYQVGACLRWLERNRGVAGADQLGREDLEAWVRSQAQRMSLRGRPLKPASLIKEIESVRSFLGWLGRTGRAGARLASDLPHVTGPRLLPQSVLTHRQMRALLAGARGDSLEGARDRAMWEVLYSSGIRAAELLGLNVADVDLANATALVLGKGNKQRVVPMGRTAVRLLESYLKGVRPLLRRDAQEPALWLNRSGGRLSYAMLRRRLLEHAGSLNLGVPVTAHTFRRSCATELIRGGANLWHVKELLGHENLDTLRHYVRLTIVDLKKTHARCHPRERDAV